MATSSVIPSAIPAVIPCKRGHTQRNRFGQCVICLRDSRKEYKKRVPKAQAPVVAPAALTQRETPAVPHSFLAVAREYLLSQDNAAPATATKRTYLLEQLRAIHDRPIAELTTPDFVRALKEIEALGDRRETAHRAGMLAGQITRYAVNHGYAPVNVLPSGQLRGALKPIKVESHAAVTDPALFGDLLGLIDFHLSRIGSRNHPSVGAALRLAPYVFVRPGELRYMEWSEVDLEKCEWIIPAEKMKMRRPHLVPLSRQAVAILQAQLAITGNGKYAFPSKKAADRALSENAFREVLDFIHRFSFRPEERHTMHGFRSSASRLLNGEFGIDSALVELQLAHVKGDRVAGIYDRSQRIPERRAMMQQWADYIDKLRATALQQ